MFHLHHALTYWSFAMLFELFIFQRSKAPRRNKEQKGQQSSVGAPLSLPRGAVSLCFSFFIIAFFWGKGR
jgi:hypothetical protein